MQIINGNGGMFTLNCQWGRRGSTLQSQGKVVDVPLAKAEATYQKVLDEKLGKGYQLDLESGSTYVTPEDKKAPVKTKMDTTGELKRKIQIDWGDEEKLIPQLLNPIEESEVEKYLKDGEWGAQEKKDGKHQMLRYIDAKLTAFNKKGKEVGYPKVWADALCTPVLLDGEAIGDTFHAFDILERSGKDYRKLKYITRHAELTTVEFGESIKIVPLAMGYKDKKALYDQLLKDGKEGVVFKKLSSEHKPGRPASGGDMVKFKFYSTASVRVVKGREGKRSIGMEILDGSKWIFIGNCTIPPNKEVPKLGDIVEIRYLNYQEGGALYQPTYLEVRDDTDPEDCVKAQLKYKVVEE